MKTSNILLFYCLLFLPGILYSQPGPGDVFREYSWSTPEGDNSKYLRVGGRLDYEVKPGIYPDLVFEGRDIPFGHEINLKGAVRAEVVVEKVLCHFGTKNLRLSWNGNAEIVFPEAEGIPEPQHMYMHHTYPVVQVPLNHLREGADNVFAMQVDDDIRWPQNLVYGLILRIYYDRASLPLPELDLVSEGVGEDNITLRLEGRSREVARVDYLGRYAGPDMNGDGIYRDWHYIYHRGELMNHLGSADKKPFEVQWDLGWVPDQDGPVELTARVHMPDGMIFMLPEQSMVIPRWSYSVELCRPEEVPVKWVTRRGENQETFSIKGNPQRISEARLVFTSWSPCYLNGIYINDFLVFTREGPCYDFVQHTVPIDDPDIFHEGSNVLKTGGTPRYHGNMVHGAEIMWPGIMVMVKYKEKKQ